MIGDGYTDYEVKESGQANQFYLFTENVKRSELIDKADHVIHSLDEFLYMHQLVRSQNFPKSKIKVLILENIHPQASAIFRQDHFDVNTISSALEEEDLIQAIKDIHILCIRSKTQVTEKVLAAATKLIAIGTFCIGTNQINKKAATTKGIPIFNAPFSNTRSVVELTISEIIMLMRNIPVKNEQMHRGIWDKSVGHASEVRGKILGIIGYGNIGSQLSVLAEALGMKVCFYDINDKLALGNARKFDTLKEVLSVSDVISLHVDGRNENTDLIHEENIRWLKNGAILINNARGHVVNMNALKNALDDKRIVGAALDVFNYEPVNNDEPFHHPLINHHQVILTPHIGGSTAQAQEHIGGFVTHKLKNYINNGDTYGAVNFPEVQLPQFNQAHRLLHIHENKSGVLAQINNIFAQYRANINSQYLQTQNEIGYVITDIDVNYSEEMIDALKKIPSTIKLRMLY
jgi:D-3-phosphoglycerate dehydrogenase